jgi:hypothetical protein
MTVGGGGVLVSEFAMFLSGRRVLLALLVFT